MQKLKRVQTRADVAVRLLTQLRKPPRAGRQRLGLTHLAQTPRDKRRRRAVEAQHTCKRAQRAQRRRIQVIAHTHNRPHKRARRPLPPARSLAALHEPHQRANKPRGTDALAAARGPIDLIDQDKRRPPTATQRVRLQRHANALLHVVRGTRIAGIQLVHTVAGLLRNDMRQRRLP